MTIPVPSQLDDLTPDWLDAALGGSATLGSTVASVGSERIGEGVGFIGQLHRVRLTYADPVAAAAAGAPASLIAKMPTSDPGGRFVGSMMRLYEKESGFYRHLAHECPVRVPRCFYNGAVPDEQQWCLLLEDMHTYDVGDQLVPRTFEQSCVLIRAMARIHARWSDGRADAHTWLPRVDDPSTSGMLAMYDDSYPVAMARYGHLVPDHMSDWGKRFAPHALAWMTDFASQPSTIVHGDFRTDNIVFSRHAPDDDFVLLDWQVSSRSPGAYDLYYFLALSPDPAVSSGRFDELVDLYLTELEAAGGTPPDRAVLLRQMRGLGLLFSVLGVVTLASLDNANVRGEELFVTMWKRSIALAERLDLSPALP